MLRHVLALAVISVALPTVSAQGYPRLQNQESNRNFADDPIVMKAELGPDKTNVDYIPLGKLPVTTPLRVELGFIGWGTGQSISMNLVFDNWPGRSTRAGKGTCYMFDNKQTKDRYSNDAAEAVEVVYKKVSASNRVWVYLKLAPEFIRCPTSGNGANNCNNARNNATITIIPGGPFYKSPIKDDGTIGGDGVDPSWSPGSPLSSEYQAMKSVHMYNNNRDTSTFTFEELGGAGSDPNTDLYIPLARAPEQSPLSVDLAVFAWGAAHGIHIDILADQFPGNACRRDDPALLPDDRVTVYIKDNKQNRGKDHAKHLDVVFRCAPQDGPMKRGAYYYLKYSPSYFYCGTGASAVRCAAQIGDAGRVAVTVKGKMVEMPTEDATAPGGWTLDPMFSQYRNTYYQTAQRTDFGDELKGQYKGTTPLGDISTDTYVLLGRTTSNGPFTSDISFTGPWFRGGIKVEVVSDFIPPARDGVDLTIPDPGRVTAMFRHNKRESEWLNHDITDYMSVVYGRQTDVTTGPRDVYYFYLRVAAGAVNCPPSTQPNSANCVTSQNRQVKVFTRGGKNLVGFADPNVQTRARFDALTDAPIREYQVATRIDVNKLPTTVEHTFVDAKSAEEWIPIGSDRIGPRQSFTLDIGTNGWGLGLSMKMEVVMDGPQNEGAFFTQMAADGSAVPCDNECAAPQAAYTVYLSDNKGIGDGNRGSWRDSEVRGGAGESGIQLSYRQYRDSTGRGRLFYYLRVNPDFIGCQFMANDADIQSCNDGMQSIKYRLTSPGTFLAGAADPNITLPTGRPDGKTVKELYATATKVILADTVTRASLPDLVGSTCLDQSNRRRDAEGNDVDCSGHAQGDGSPDYAVVAGAAVATAGAVVVAALMVVGLRKVVHRGA